MCTVDSSHRLILSRLPGPVCAHSDISGKLQCKQDRVAIVQVCQRTDGEAVMLLCEWCQCGMHIGCHDPALTTVPVEDWYCARHREHVDLFKMWMPATAVAASAPPPASVPQMQRESE